MHTHTYIYTGTRIRTHMRIRTFGHTHIHEYTHRPVSMQRCQSPDILIISRPSTTTGFPVIHPASATPTMQTRRETFNNPPPTQADPPPQPPPAPHTPHPQRLLSGAGRTPRALKSSLSTALTDLRASKSPRTVLSFLSHTQTHTN